MISKKIYTNLMSLGFNSVSIDKDNISLFQRLVGEMVTVVALYDCPSGLEYTAEQLTYIDKQIRNHYHSKGHSNVDLLGVVITNKVENIRDVAIMNNNFWILDSEKKSLIIYENQEGQYNDIRKQIGNVLAEVRLESLGDTSPRPRQSYSNKVSTKSKSGMIRNLLSQWNTILIIINVLVYFIVDFISRKSGQEHIVMSGAQYWPSIVHGHEYYRLLTYMFLHSNITHLANNMLVMFFLGGNLERVVGKWNFLIIYFGSGVIAGIVSMLYNMFDNLNVISIGASGAIFGIVGAMVNLVIRNKGRLVNISSRQMIMFVVFSLYGGLTSQGIDNAAHIGGLFAGLILAAIFCRTPKSKMYNYIS